MEESTLLNILTLHKNWLDEKEGERADLSEANLRGAISSGADLRWADLRRANLSEADLSEANLRGADLRWADLSGAKIEKANFDYTTVGIHEAPQGELTVWGKKSGHILQFTVPADTPRSCATLRKYRSENVITVSIDDGELDELVHVTRYGDVMYKVGEVTHCNKWDDDRWNECSGGIHWFLTRIEAEEWNE